MYAIVEVGAKQYNVKKGDVIEVEKLENEAGKALILDKVLLVSGDGKAEIGQPYIKGASVKAAVLGQIKADKVITYKYRRRKAYHLKKGHRQKMTRIKIEEIKAG
ncbi:MAG: 50S ribosomal protein L21 [Candidatus Omnitrophota bacterium]